jgi:hypothetical protein
LSWSDQESFHFAFKGIPRGCPVAACECVTASHSEGDRQRFHAGLKEAVNQIEPANIVVYGGTSHTKWLLPHLPPGPRFHLLNSFSRARAHWRRMEAQKHQLNLFSQEAA